MIVPSFNFVIPPSIRFEDEGASDDLTHRKAVAYGERRPAVELPLEICISSAAL